MKMVLESLEPKVNDKILKNFFFQNFGGFRPPLKPPKNLKIGVLRGPKPPKILKKYFFFSKLFHFLWALSFPEPSSYLIFNFRKYFKLFFENFSYFLYLGTHEMGSKMAKEDMSWSNSQGEDRALKFFVHSIGTISRVEMW